MTRVEYVSKEIGATQAYHLLTALVVPRPIAWVTTRSVKGIDNIAPFSFCGVIASDPPLVMFSTVGWKDSSRNARDTGEFVFHLAPAELLTPVNLTAIDYPDTVDEFAAVGLTKEDATSVVPPRIAESPAALECRVTDVTERGNCVMVVGEVVRFVVDESKLVNGRPNFDLLAPLGRLNGPDWALPGTVHTEARVMYEPGMNGDNSVVEPIEPVRAGHGPTHN